MMLLALLMMVGSIATAAEAPIGPMLNHETIPVALSDLRKDAESLRAKIARLEAELAADVTKESQPKSSARQAAAMPAEEP